MGQLRLVVLFVTAVGLTSLMACSATRVQVASPPSDDAPIAERMAYYERHKLNITADEVTASAWFKSSPVQPVVLTNGARVEDHRDLLPLLEPESATAQSIADANATHTWMQMTGGVGAVMMGAAPLVFSIGLRDPPPLNPNAPSGGPSMETLAAIVVGVALFSTGLGFMSVSSWLEAQTADANTSALQTYDDDLRERLGLHADLPPNTVHPLGPSGD